MKHTAILGLCGVLALTPAQAQHNDELSEGMDLLSQGMQLFFEGLMSEMEPTLRGLEDALGDLGDWGAYHPPEVLPNGDIILRRKTPPRPEPELEPGENGEIDL